MHAYHTNPEKQSKILERYLVNVPAEEATDPSLNVPRFILPEKFDARKDTLQFDWGNKNSFLEQVREKLNTPEMKKKIKRADLMFDFIAFSIFALHIFMAFWGVYYKYLSTL